MVRKGMEDSYMFGLFRSRVFITLLLAFLSCSAKAVGTISVPVTLQDTGTIGLNVTSSQRALFNILNVAGGNNDLTISSITTSNPEFNIFQPTTFPVVIPAGGSYLLVVDFTPTAQGPRIGNMTITSDDSAGNTSIVVTATGYGGLETAIDLFPKNIEIATGQGMVFRAEVTYDNGAKGPIQMNWASSSPAVASATDDGIDTGFTKEVSAGAVEALSLGSTTITAQGVNVPAVSASTSVFVVAPEPFELVGASSEDRITTINESGFNLCYDFPETDTEGLPLYSVNQVGVTTINVAEIDEIYITADSSAGNSEEIFNLPNDCSSRTTVFSNAGEFAVFSDLVVDSLGRGIAANLANSNLWQVEPGQAATTLVATGLPNNDIGKLAIDDTDNVYAASLVETTAERNAAVYVRPAGLQQWFPVAAVFNTLKDFSVGLAGIAAIKLDNQGYAMKVASDWDKTIVEKYVDLNMDGNFYEIVGTSFIPDPGEIIEVAQVTAGVDISVDSERRLIASVGELGGRNVMRMTDLNGDGDFDDSRERRVVYQSNAFTSLVDIAFASPCSEQPPNAVIGFLPPSGVVELNENVILLGGGSNDPCNDTLTYEWDFDGDGNPDSTTPTSSTSWGGLPDLHDVTLTVTDPVGNTDTAIGTVKVGPPGIDGFWPGDAAAGTFVFIFGKNFVTATGSQPNVCFNGICTFATQVVSSDMVISLLPSGSTAGDITLTNPIGTATAPGFGIPPNPGDVVVNGFWRGQVSAGEIVFVFGSGFSLVPGGMQVTLNGVQQFAVQPVTQDMFLFVIPPGSTSGPICATVSGTTGCSGTDIVILP